MATGLAVTVEMGRRQYDPLLGRFLQADPLEGGSCNDYDYVCGDPRNDLDLNGTKRWFGNEWVYIDCGYVSCSIYMKRRVVRQIADYFGSDEDWSTTTGFTTAFGAVCRKMKHAIAIAACTIIIGFGIHITKKRFREAKEKSGCVAYTINGWAIALLPVSYAYNLYRFTKDLRYVPNSSKYCYLGMRVGG